MARPDRIWPRSVYTVRPGGCSAQPPHPRFWPSSVTRSINIPNQITLLRLGLAVVFCISLALFSADRFPENRWQLAVSFWIFLIAVLTDVLDGYLARAWRQVTTFGRIVDPFVDKVLICTAFLYFASGSFAPLTGVRAWMAVLILARELLVSALRAQAESAGRDFSATLAGKMKMFVQSFTACAVLGTLAFPVFAWLQPLAYVCVWISVLVTVLSMIGYVRKSRDFLFSAEALGGSGPPRSVHSDSPPASSAEKPSTGTAS